MESERVNSSTEASGSKPRSNTKNNRILPAKSDNKKKIEAHPRNNKSKLKQENRVDSSISSKRYSKYMTGNRSRLKKFVKTFIGTVRFENDHFGAIMGYGDYAIGDSVISKVYYVEGLGHNHFSVDGVELLKDNGIEFVNQVLTELYESVGIFHQKSVLRTPQHNGVVERRNRTLVEAARTILIFSKAPMFLWAEAVATAFFGALCYPTNDSEDLGKLIATSDIRIFVGYAPNRKGY
ncbi:integrase, catalytic region, zinc finger, CCHC-type containing protein [Tanacetum coccineum]